MIDVILKEIEIVIILRRQSSKSVIGVDCAYTGIVKLRSKTIIGVVSICLYKDTLWEGIADILIQTF